ncbi:arabinofuranosidase [Microthyrium microscopicum]|uniref:Arabinofuranosidase n=1 Tax=Microthyrium microscopicum TaxID=703497 RepID=A0A6A6U7K0_9PEZI|nr:arabinofuranosidase [Microthyrium microscopicum]
MFWLLPFLGCGFVSLVGSQELPRYNSTLGSTALAAATFTNPLRQTNGADPFIITHQGYYYFMTTTYTDIKLTRSRTIEGLKTGETRTVYKDATKDRCCNVWSPQLAAIDGTWYIYFTSGQADNSQQRARVLKGGNHPWSTYTYANRITDEWATDGTVTDINRQHYYIFSCSRKPLLGKAQQALCIAPFQTPTKLGAISVISQPTAAWESADGLMPVNAGPSVIYYGGRYIMAHSGTYCTSPSTAIGLMTLENGMDPTRAASWTKSGPVLGSAYDNYGPGHMTFFRSLDDKEVWSVYHATSNPRGACDKSRYTMAYIVEWDDKGNPLFRGPPPLNARNKVPSGE